MKSKNKIVVLVLCFLFILSGITTGTICLIDKLQKDGQVAPSNSIGDTTSYVSVGELYSDEGSFNSTNLKKLYEYITGKSNATLSDVRSLVSSNGGRVSSATMRSKTYRKTSSQDIQVTIGGLVWDVVYLTNDKGGNIAMTLWLSNCVQDAFAGRSQTEGDYYGYLKLGIGTALYSDWSSDWYSNNFNTNYPSVMYGTSYVRAVTLNNGGKYSHYDSVTDGAVTATLKDAVKSTSSAFAQFTINGINGSIAPYITKPSQIAWQETETSLDSNTIGQSYTFPNEAYGTPSSVNYYSGGSGSMSAMLTGDSATYYSIWKDDYIWLPSVTEIGYNNSHRGLWDCSVYQRKNLDGLPSGENYADSISVGSKQKNFTKLGNFYYSVRSGAEHQPYCTRVVRNDGNGDLDYSRSFISYGIRPAFHLNLSLIDTNQIDILEEPINKDFWIDSGNYGTTSLAGSGTESDPYLIQRPRDLARLTYLIYSSSTSDHVWHAAGCYNSFFKQKYFRQTCDLDMSAHYWTPIGTMVLRNGDWVARCFSGFYDGGGYTIDGIFTPAGTGEVYNRAGLFGSVIGYNGDYYASVKNVVLGRNSYIKGDYHIGGIVGDPFSSTEIINCKNYAKVTATEKVGGIAGLPSGRITDCENYGKITGKINFTGGICGYASPNVITNCKNYGDVNGYYSTGGIAGYCEGSILRDCVNNGKVNSTYSRTGGILGYGLRNSEVYNCTNNGEVKSTYGNTAGIVGYASSTVVKIFNCTNYGNIISDESNVGGIAGHINSHDITDCKNYGTIYGRDRVGGILGRISGCASAISCENFGNINGYENVGGIVGDWQRFDPITNNIVQGMDANFSYDNWHNMAVSYDASSRVITLTAKSAYDPYSSTKFDVDLVEGKKYIINATPMCDDFIIGAIAIYYELSSTWYSTPHMGKNTSIIITAPKTGTINIRFDLEGYASSNVCTCTISDFYIREFNEKIDVNTYVKNCVNKGDIFGNKAVGGIVGISSGDNYIFRNYIVDCKNFGLIESNVIGGGILGLSERYTEIENCYNEGTISGSNTLGGIVGKYLISQMTNSKNNGIVMGDYGIGGVVGNLQNSTITKSSNEGFVHSISDTIGGIVSYMTYSTLNSCYNTGTISSYSTKVGGIVGHINGGSDYTNNFILNCYNTGSINSLYSEEEASNGIGGIAGKIQSYTVISNCYNTGTVNAPKTYNVAGILGGASGNTIYIYNSFNAGKISANGTTFNGGLVGYQRACVYNCYMSGNSYSQLFGHISTMSSSANNEIIYDINSTFKNVYWYTASENWYSGHEWDFDSIWFFKVGQNNNYPINQSRLISFDPNQGYFDSQGYIHDDEYVFDGTNWVSLGKSYMFTDKFYFSCEAYMDDWSQFEEGKGMQLISSTQNGGWSFGTCAVTNAQNESHNYISASIYDSLNMVGGYPEYRRIITNRSHSSLSSGWHTFELSFDGDYAYLYVDGVLEGTSEKFLGHLAYINESGMFLGAESGGDTITPDIGIYGSELFVGKMRNIRLLNTTREQAFDAVSQIEFPIVNRNEYAFDGWWSERDGGYRVNNSSYLYPLNPTVYAHWKNIYHISFNANGGVGEMETQDFVYDKPEPLSLNNFTKTGYTFIGWAVSQAAANDSDVTYQNGAIIQNLTLGHETFELYAVWKANTYTIAYDANGGSGYIQNQEATYDRDLDLTENTFTKIGYSFVGWAKNKNLADLGEVDYQDKQQVNNLTAISGETFTLYAVWKINCSAKYDSNYCWYVEIGAMPQSRVSQSMNFKLNTLYNSNAVDLILSENAYKVSSEITLQGYFYNDIEYCLYQGQWYKVEPIRWRLAGTYEEGQIVSGGVNAVLDTIVYIDAYSSGTTEYSIGAVDTFAYNLGNNGNNMSNLIAFTPTNLAGREDKIYIASEAEIQAVAGSYDVKFSDLVCDIVGTRYYYTRTPANDGNMRIYSYLGFASASAPTYQHGVQFVVKVAEFVCI